jgi:L-amino acid N-acyltransferase YncA
VDLMVRDARPEDARGVLAVFNPIIESGLDSVFATPFTEEAERRYIAELSDRAIFHVAVRTEDATIVGFQGMEPFATYTGAFDHVGVVGTYVDRAARRQGVARRLFAATFEAARRKGYEKIFTYIREDNAAARATYAAHGFRVVGTARQHAKIQGRYVDEIIVERQL